MKVTLYTTHCPQCNSMVALLHRNNVEYTEFTDVSAMQKMGLTYVP